MNTLHFKSLPTLHAIVWVPNFAGMPERIVRAYPVESDAENDPRAGKSDWDGVIASTRGSYRVLAMEPSGRLVKLHSNGALLGESQAGDEGAWRDGEPCGPVISTKHGIHWEWTVTERLYIRALAAA